jgi:adenine-specific DNA-methyltransferase
MHRLLHEVHARVLVISFNSEGYMNREAMETLCAGLWEGKAKVVTLTHDYKRYVGAQIGIYNLKGEKVGKVSHLRNKEYLYVVSREDLSARFEAIRS